MWERFVFDKNQSCWETLSPKQNPEIKLARLSSWIQTVRGLAEQTLSGSNAIALDFSLVNVLALAQDRF